MGARRPPPTRSRGRGAASQQAFAMMVTAMYSGFARQYRSPPLGRFRRGVDDPPCLALILLAAAAVVGVLELVDAFLTSATVQIVQIAPEPWPVPSPLTGVLRVAGLAAVGVATTGVVLAVVRRFGRRMRQLPTMPIVTDRESLRRPWMSCP